LVNPSVKPARRSSVASLTNGTETKLGTGRRSA